MNSMELKQYARTSEGICEIVLVGMYDVVIDYSRNLELMEIIPQVKLEEDIIKMSDDIFDLIEIGDYILGEKVIEIHKPKSISIYDEAYVVTTKARYGYELEKWGEIYTKEHYYKGE